MINGAKSMGIVDGAQAQEAAPRPSQILFDRATRTFSSLASLPSNVEAVDNALRFSAGLDTQSVLVGPSGWGKTHLLGAVAERMSSERSPVRLASVIDHIRISDPMDVPGALLLDDCQDVLDKPKMRLLLRIHLERRVRLGRATMLAFTLPKPIRLLNSLLPSERHWSVSILGTPAPAERVKVIEQMATAEGLSLSVKLIRIIATRIHGNGRTLSGALNRLRAVGPSWLTSQATLRACGLLEPFFADNSGWDLKLRILRLADRNRSLFGRALPTDLAIYTMLREAGLGEQDIARSLEIEPSAVYLRATRFAQTVALDPNASDYVARFVDLIVDSIATE